MKLFLRKAAGRAKKNRIKMLKQDDGMVTKDKGEMENMADTFSGFIHGRSCCATIGTMGSLWTKNFSGNEWGALQGIQGIGDRWCSIPNEATQSSRARRFSCSVLPVKLRNHENGCYQGGAIVVWNMSHATYGEWNTYCFDS
jgi:hypothetical protein